MTLQVRYDAKKAEAQQLANQHEQARAQLGQIQQRMIALDAELALLEDLLKTPTPAPKKRR